MNYHNISLNKCTHFESSEFSILIHKETGWLFDILPVDLSWWMWAFRCTVVRRVRCSSSMITGEMEKYIDCMVFVEFDMWLAHLGWSIYFGYSLLRSSWGIQQMLYGCRAGFVSGV